MKKTMIQAMTSRARLAIGFCIRPHSILGLRFRLGCARDFPFCSCGRGLAAGHPAPVNHPARIIRAKASFTVFDGCEKGVAINITSVGDALPTGALELIQL